MPDLAATPDPGPVSQALTNLAARGVLQADTSQARAAQMLDRIAGEVASKGETRGWWTALFQPAPKKLIRGAYLVGDVGRGKTMLMDLFFDQVPTTRKRRLHFHEFMDEIHTGIAEFRAKTKGREDNTDPVEAVTRPMIGHVDLLCLDEFHVQDITNAMLLGRLFEQLFAAGIVLVATSNTEPDDLYRDGLNRQLFLPFIGLLKQHADIVRLDGNTDYRRLKFEGERVFRFGSPERLGPEMDALWLRMTGGEAGGPSSLTSLGRTIAVPRAAMGAARFSASDLLDAPLGARDYLKLAHAFDAIMIEDVPRFERTRSNAAKRFILLVDTLYDRGIKLAASFTVPLEQLAGDERTAAEFGRTTSRLLEMSSREYLEAPARPEAQTKG